MFYVFLYTHRLTCTHLYAHTHVYVLTVEKNSTCVLKINLFQVHLKG